MRIFHITSPCNAVAIVESGIFYSSSDQPLNNDNGLNCFCYKSGYQMEQCFEGEGAQLVLDWCGPVVVTHPQTSPPLAPNVLHDQHPWRCFVRGGTNAQLLRVVDIRFAKENIGALVASPSWYRFLPAAIRNKLERRRRHGFLRSLRSKYRNADLFLKVVG